MGLDRVRSSVGLGVFTLGLAFVGCDQDEGEPGPGGTSSGSIRVEDAGSGGDASTRKKAAEVGCAADVECETDVCFRGNGQSFCTVRCTTAEASTICVAPYTGSCNKQGYCKRD